MCTIGNVFIPADNGVLSFKQCDLKVKTQFLPPQIVKGTGDIQYYPFTRVGSNGPWAGVNNYGVSFVAADAYMEVNEKNEAIVKDVPGDIFEAYTKILSDCTSAQQAADYMSNFYKTFGSPDILMINDATASFFIETDGQAVECIKRTDKFFACTNHFRMLYGGVLYPHNHSSYLRLARAEAILQNDTSTDGVYDVLRDQYFGETVFSVCRVNKQTPPQEEPYFTQATALFYVNGRSVNCAYQLNGNPRTNSYINVSDIFRRHQITENVSIDEINELLTSEI